jgi:hypothetical protein
MNAQEGRYRNFSYSFKPDGSWFVFDLDTGLTIATPSLKSAKKARMEWIRQRSTPN